MQTALMADLHESNLLSPVRMSAKLGMPLAELAQVAGLSLKALSLEPGSTSVQEHLGQIANILSQVEELTGNPDRAVPWFRESRIAGHGGRTPMMLVAEGQASAVLAHIEDLRNGVYA